MEFAEEKENGDEFIAVSGEEEVEEVEEEIEEQSSERGANNVDNAGDVKKQSVVGDSSSGKIFVGGVAWETTEETFTNHFEKYGEITDSVIMRDKHTKRPRGFGFITFADPAVLEKVLEDEHVINGRMVEVKRTVPREDMQSNGGPKTKKIFVGGIPPSFTEDELKEYFSSYGDIVEHQIMLDNSTGRSRGFGFVTFKSEDTVEEIISEGKTHELGGKQVEIKKAEPKRGGDQGYNARAHYGSGVTNSYGGFGGGAVAYGGGYRSRGGYGGYGEGYNAGPASVYGGYGGYGAGAGFGGAMYGGAGYEGYGYGSTGGYGGAYSGAGNYGGSRGYGSNGAANGRYHPYGR